MSIVIDASIAIAWALPDEFDPSADSTMQYIKKKGGIVPGLWHLEIANILLLSERKKRIAPQDLKDLVEDLRVLPITIDFETATRAFGDTLAFAERHRLSLYDAAYLELAHRKGLPLATLDRELVAAARGEGMEVITSIPSV